MAVVRPKETGSFAGPVFREGFNLVTAREASEIGPGASSPHNAVLVGSPGSNQYEPEDPDNAGLAWRDPHIVKLGAGDGLEIIAGGSDGNNETIGCDIYLLEPVVNSEGTVIAFLDRLVGAATFTLSTTTLGASDALVVGFDEIENGDRIADSVAWTGTAALGSEIITPTLNIAWASIVLVAHQSTIVRFNVNSGFSTSNEVWLLARRIQGDALGVNR